MTRFSDDAIERSDFLDGQVAAWQPVNGYRSGVDAVLLAAAVPAKSGETALELGSGAGVASLCLDARIAGLTLQGLEPQEAYAALSERNAQEARMTWRAHRGTVTHAPADLKAQMFDHVFANPPYFEADSAPEAATEGRDRARRENAPLSAWIDCALRRLKPRGTLTLIQRTERVAEICVALNGRAGDITIKPLAARSGRDATRLLLRAQKESRGPVRLCAPLILHEGETHLSDAEDYSPLAQAILRGGAPLEF